jgi:hypothetical protein
MSTGSNALDNYYCHTTPASMIAVEHWFEELQRRVPMNGK